MSPEGDQPKLLARMRAATPARLMQGLAGVSTPIAASLEFQLAHARARDAVHSELDVPALTQALAPRHVIAVRSAAVGRDSYLRRPDLGRRLDAGCAGDLPAGPFDIVFVVGDGLSAAAAHRHAPPLIEAALALLTRYSVGPIVIASQARVALGDEIGAAMAASMVVVMLGERPGLSAPNSLGIYATYAPRAGLRDSQRNCISNIQEHGLGHAAAAQGLAYLVDAAFAQRRTGVALEDYHGPAAALPLRTSEKDKVRNDDGN